MLELLQNGHRDPGFGRHGQRTLDVAPGVSFQAVGVAFDSEGRILVAGTTFAQEARWATVYRFLPGGRLDPSFGRGGVVEDTFNRPPPIGEPEPPKPNFSYPAPWVDVTGFAVEQGDQPVLFGDWVTAVQWCPFFPSNGLPNETYIARLTASGAPDMSFGSDGIATSALETPAGLSVGTDGSVTYASEAHRPCARVAEDNPATVSVLGSEGVLRNRFLAEGAPPAFVGVKVGGIATDSHGRIDLLLNEISGEGGPTVVRVERWSPLGTPDRRFGSGGSTIVKATHSAVIDALAVDRRGRVTLAGSIELECGGLAGCFLLRRLTASGKIDRRFGHSGVTRTSLLPIARVIPPAMSIDRKGRIVVAGLTGEPSSGSPLRRIAVARYVG